MIEMDLLTYVDVLVYNPADLMRSIKVELLVDSGALFTAIPCALLEGLGLRPIAKRKLMLLQKLL